MFTSITGSTVLGAVLAIGFASGGYRHGIYANFRPVFLPMLF